MTLKNLPDIKKFFFVAAFFTVLPFVFYYDTAAMKGILGELDGLIYFFPYRLSSYLRWSQGIPPLWNPYSLCGFPQLAALQPGALYFPNMILFSLFTPVAAFNLSIFLHLSMAGFFTYLYMRSLQASTIPSLFAGVAFMFCGFLAQWANIGVIVNSSIWLPAILLFMNKAANSKKIIYAFFAACCFTMMIFVCYPQVLLCAAMVVGFYIFYLTACADKNRPTVFFYGILVVALGCLLGAIQLLPTKELADLSIRTILSTDHPIISLTSFKLKYAVLFLFPYLFGSLNPGFYPQHYWETSPFPYMFEGVCYMGILTMLLAGTAVLKRHKGDRIVLFWLCVVIVTCIILLGNNNPFFPIIFKIFFLSRFYAVEINMYVLNFAFAILSGLGLDYLIRNGKTKFGKKFFIFISASLLPIPVIVYLMLGQPINGNMVEHLKKLFGILPAITSPAIYIPLLSMSASGLIYCLLILRPANKIIQTLLILILFLDLFFFGHFLHQRSINVDELIHKDKYPPVIQYLNQTEKDPNAYRVFPLVSALAEIRSCDFIVHNINILYPISSITVYDALYLKKYYTLLNPEDRNGTFRNPGALAANNRIISFLNVKYLVALPQYKTLLESMRATAIAGSPRLFPLIGESSKPENPKGETVPLYTKVFTSPSGVTVYLNRNVLPRAYLVEKVRSVKGIDEVCQILYNADESFDPSREALVEGPGPDAPAALTSGTATVISYKAQEVIIKTQSSGNGFLVLSDTYYPGWKAFIDGKETKIYATNGVVRGVFISPGNHEVIFEYSPGSFKAGALISFTTFVLVVIASIISLTARRNKI